MGGTRPQQLARAPAGRRRASALGSYFEPRRLVMTTDTSTGRALRLVGAEREPPAYDLWPRGLGVEVGASAERKSGLVGVGREPSA